MHHRFVNIHPFDDGNGRLARILMNLILMKNGYPPAIIKLNERTDYYAALNQADKNEYQPITELIAETVLESMNLYLKAARGESIENVSDLDKEIALFKGSFEKTYLVKDKEAIINVFKNVLLSISKIAELRFIQFDDLFLRKGRSYYFDKDEFYQDIETEDGDIFTVDDKGDFGHFNINDIDKIAAKAFDRLIVSYQWISCNKSVKYLDFKTDLITEVKRINYEIKLNNVILFSKHYDDNVTDFEKQDVANKWVRFAFDDLKNKIEEANKK